MADSRQRTDDGGLFEAILEHSADLVAVLSVAGEVIYDSPAIHELLGYRPEEREGRSVFDLVHPEDEAAQRELLEDVQEAGPERTFRTKLRLQHKNGGWRTFEALARNLTGDPRIGGILVDLRDITDREREAELDRLRGALLDHVGQAVIGTDPEGTVIYWNAAAEALYGYSWEEAMGRPVVELTVPKLSLDSASEIMEQLSQGEGWSGEYEVQRKDGTTFPAYVSNQPVMEDGELAWIIGISSDLTERKELERQLQQAQKMEAVGQLAGGIAHEFNNLLTTIGGYAALISEAVEDPQVSADLNQIQEASQRARSLADKLLAFSRRRRATLQPVELTGLLHEMIAVLTRGLGEDIRLKLDLTPVDRMWPCTTDPGLMEQAIMNLVINARDAMPEGGTVTVKTDRVSLDAERVAELDAELEPGDYVRLRVSDDGTGIEPDVLPRIFEPFFTTKGVGQGSGLGLSMVYGAVRQSGGGVTVESEPGEGTTFAMYLPRAEDAEVPEREHGEPVREGPKRILLVEDEDAVRSLARRILERGDYELLEARTGQEALALYEGADVPVDLVVTDVIMPEMGGPELVQELRQRSPEVRSLFISGYTADELESRGLDRQAENFLPKPFTPRDLLDAVQRALKG